MTFLTTFIVLSIINVIFSTIRTLVTINGSKTIASIVSGGYFAFYNVMLIFTVADFPLWQKCVITFVCNVIGVWIVKFFEEKMRKEKLWKIEMTIKPMYKSAMVTMLEELNISYNYIDIDRWYVFNVYSKTQKESALVKSIADACHAKYFVTETKTL
jgi:uncharacterized protein YebE (UPF0316 family)